MICAPCREGADIELPTETNIGMVTRSLAELREDALQRRAALHAGCRGGTWCDCQHRPVGRMS